MARAQQTTEPKAGAAELTRLRKENEELRSRLERIAELASGDEEDLDEDEDEDDEDEEDEEEEEE